MGKLIELLRAPAKTSQEAVEAMLQKLEEMDALLDEVCHLRVENAELRALIHNMTCEDDLK